MPKVSECTLHGLRKILSRDVSSSSVESTSLASRCSPVHALSVTVSTLSHVIAQMSYCDLCVIIHFCLKEVHD